VRTINFSDARGNLKEVLDQVTSDHTITLIKRRDAEDAVVMSLSDYNSLQETLYLFGNATNAARLHQAIAEADATLPAGARVLGPEDVAKRAAAKHQLKKVIVDRSHASGALIRRHVGVETKVKAGGRVPTERSNKPLKVDEFKAAAAKVAAKAKKKA
jgi:antitoxin YefM